ncbi:MAG: response regulator transcription factor [Candidatus Sericytochromatia bacterium]|nr:response regulator transcription factor [Candidatus Sericytochromatia bacterium]
MSRILIVDDDPLIIDLVTLNLQLSGYDVESAGDGAAGLARARSGIFHAAIIDVMMPKLDGYQLVQQLRQLPQTRALPIIVLTAKGTLDDKVRGFDAGADDYLVKPFEPQELLVRLRAVLRRQQSHPQSWTEILTAGDVVLFPEALQVRLKKHAVTLTPTEFEIVHCLLQHVDQPVTLATILQEVWGYDADEDVEMLRVHVRHLRLKLEAEPKAPRYLVTVPNVGYRLAVSP